MCITKMMTTITETAYLCFLHLYKYVAFLSPWNILYNKRLKKPGRLSETKVLRAISILDGGKDGSRRLTDIIRSLPADEDISQICDATVGYSIMQHAIIANRNDIVYLLFKKFGSRAFSCSCSLPLQLASYLGNDALLKFLIDNNFRIESRDRMCYPRGHKAMSYEQKFYLPFGKFTYLCDTRAFTSIECAIISDQLDCLKLLLEKSAQSKPPEELLLFSCQYGAKNCIQYILEYYPEKINEVNELGETPLHLSVTWGCDCVKMLLKSGADVHAISGMGETALHRLYRTDIDGLFTIYDTTKYLLSHGLEQDINALNGKGETALHVLVTHISYIGGNIIDPDHRKLNREDLQIDYQDQVIMSIEAMLEFNADIHALNSLGLQPFAKLLHMPLRNCLPGRLDSCIDLNSKYQYKNDYSTLKQAVEIMVSYGCDVNSQCPGGHTPLGCLLECLLYESKNEIVNNASYILDTIKLILHHSANPNFVRSNDQATCSTLLAKIGERYFSRDDSAASGINDAFAHFVNEALVVMLKYGLDPNHISMRKSPHLSGGRGNGLIDFVRLTERIVSTAEFKIVHMWIKTMLQWGADPDMEPYPSEPIICHSQSSIFLKKQGTQPLNHYIHEVKDSTSMFHGGHAKELLLLFYNTMDHEVLFNCLNTAKFMARFHPLGATGHDFLKILDDLSEHPRTLQQCSRVAIYKSMNRQVAQGVDSLPLPRSLKQFILELR